MSGSFRYSTTRPAACDDTFGTRAPATGGTALGTGSAGIAFWQSISGLTMGTTYYYCAIASNSEGTSFGALVAFSTLAAPGVTTMPATFVSSSSATLNGAANPNGGSSVGWFRYSTTSPGTCSDTFGTRAPSTSGTGLGAGTSNVAFMQSIAGLVPGTTYYYCAIANNSYGTGFGAVFSFTTPVAKPAVTTSSASALTGASAQLNGAANPGGDATTGWFRYATTSPGTCNDTFGTRAPTTGGASLGAGTTAVAFNQAIMGLSAGTTYYYCAIASNSVGTGVGNVASFTTPAAPTVTSTGASGLGNTSATLNGSAVPNRAAATGWFRYSATNPGSCNDTFGSRAPATGGTALGSGSAGIAYLQSVTGLSAGTTYYYCAIASNSEGTAFGAVLIFSTLAAPSVTTVTATAITSSSATLNGAANPNGATATGWFRYSATNPGSCTDSFGTRAPASLGTALGAGTASAAYSQALAGLLPATTYYYCAIASNTYGTGLGAVFSFTTPAASPVVSTSSASLLTGTTATLNGVVNPGGDATTGWFRYATSSPGTCNDTFGTRAPTAGGSAAGSGTSTVSFSQAVTGLTPATTYYFCAIAANSVGNGFGSVRSFTTPSIPTVTTSSASGLTSTAATLNGNANPNRAAATGWFRYSSTNPGSCNDTFGTRAPATGGTALGAGSAAVAFVQSISGLSTGTTYYYCAIASNSEGTGFGAVLTFTTLAAPAVTTSAPTSVTSSSATLNGLGNPNGATSTGWFRYATTSPGTCNDTFGTRAPASLGTSLGAGTSNVAFSQSVAGLQPATIYYYCAIANNSYGTGFGTVFSFTTPAAKPTVSTGSASMLTGTTAQLNGTANPGGDTSTGWFRYATTSPGTCNDTFGTRAPMTGGSALGAGTATVPFNQAITGLTPSTTYFVCALASNSVGSAVGAVVSFTTPAAPTVTTSPASSVAGTSATLNGLGNPNRATSTGWFRYATTNPGTCNDTFGTRAPATGGTALGAGSANIAFAQPATGLTMGTTYYYCAIASNSEGTAFGAVLSLTTLAAPSVTTTAPTSVTPSSATLNGAANPNGATSTGWFRYATTSPGTCNDTFGTRAPATSGTSLGAGTASVAYAQSVAGLTPSTTYYYCAIANNIYGTGFGSVFSFTTPAAKPTVTTGSASMLTGTTAQLNGTANPGGDTSTGWFRYATTSPGTCNDTFGTRAPMTGGTSLGGGTMTLPFLQAVTGLTPSTTYYVCAIASNSVGTSVGAVVSFTTPAAPTVTTLAVSGLSSTSVTLNGSANPNRAATTGWFRYATTNPGMCSDTFGTRAPTTGGSPLGAGAGVVSYLQAVTGLTAGTTYYYCAIASNSEGTALGTVLSFTTLAVPSVTTNAASSLAPTSATLNGAANPNGAAATGWFRYAATSPASCNDTFGTRAPATGGTALGAGSSSVAFTQAITGLLPGVTYYYCALAVNSVGTSFGAVQSFTTPASPPTVSTAAPSGVTTTTATLNGAANPNGAGATGWFRIATTNPGVCDDVFGTRVPLAAGAALGAGNSAVGYSDTAAGIMPGTTYYYCAIAANSAGTSVGSIRTFTTPAPPTVNTQAATPVTTTTATLNASANPNGSATTGWFRYATTTPGSCNDTFGTRTPTTGGTGLGTGTAPVNYAQPLTGLSPATTYYFCAIASSSIGTSFGAVLAFTTPPTSPGSRAPSGAVGSGGNVPTVVSPVTTLAASAIVAESVVLHGSGNPGGEPATGWFRFGTTDPGSCSETFGARAPQNGGEALGDGKNAVDFSQTVSGLAPATTYYYCAVAATASGTSFGAVLSVTTRPAPPRTTTAPPTDVVVESARLHGSAVPNGEASTGWFRYSAVRPERCDDSFGVRLPAEGGHAVGAGTREVAFSETGRELVRGTTYYYCAIAASSLGTTFGELVAFVPGAHAPIVTTEAAIDVERTTVTLGGSAVASGSPATGWFRFGEMDPGTCDDAFGSRAPLAGTLAIGPAAAVRPDGDGEVSAPRFTEVLTGLKPNMTYYYCAAAENQGGATFGKVRSFKTAAAPAGVRTVAMSVSGADSAMITMTGAVDPRGAETGAWFRYDTAHPGVCSDGFGTRSAAAPGTLLGAGREAVVFEQRVTDLAPGTYYACVIAENAGGLSFGEVLTFHVTSVEPADAGGCSYGGSTATGGFPLWLVAILPLLGLMLRRRRRV